MAITDLIVQPHWQSYQVVYRLAYNYTVSYPGIAIMVQVEYTIISAASDW